MTENVYDVRGVKLDFQTDVGMLKNDVKEVILTIQTDALILKM